MHFTHMLFHRIFSPELFSANSAWKIPLVGVCSQVFKPASVVGESFCAVFTRVVVVALVLSEVVAQAGSAGVGFRTDRAGQHLQNKTQIDVLLFTDLA